jgi:hypothetical protein
MARGDTPFTTVGGRPAVLVAGSRQRRGPGGQQRWVWIGFAASTDVQP